MQPDLSAGRSWEAPWLRTSLPSTVAMTQPNNTQPNNDQPRHAESANQQADSRDALASSCGDVESAIQSFSSSDRRRHDDDDQEANLRSRISESLDTDTSFTRRASRLAGFSDSGRGSITREELMEQGFHGRDADAIIVRVHENEILMAHFRRWILCFSCIMILSMPAMLAIFIWMVIVWWNDLKKDCDVPLQTWVVVTMAIVVYNATINRPTQHGSIVVRFCCCWSPDPEHPEPMPLRVRLYSAAVTIFIFVWNCIGLHWSRITGNSSSNLELPSCKDVAPDLVLVVRVYSAFNLAFTIFMYVNMIGLAHLLRAAMRLGLVHTSNAAPKGALEKNTAIVKDDDPAFEEQASCSVCLEDFCAAPAVSAEIRKTHACGHLFHTACLQRWLNVNRTCPLCRQDLGDVNGDSSALVETRLGPDAAHTEPDDTATTMPLPEFVGAPLPGTS